MKTLVYGSLNIDSTFALDHIVQGGETQASFGLTKAAGGKGANQCAAIAKALGKDLVFMAGKAGYDGAFILEKLSSFGVDVSNVALCEEGTGQAIIQLDRNGQNSIILFGGGNQLNTTDEMDSVLSKFSADDVLVMNAEINNLDYLFNKAVEKGMKVWVNPSPITDALLALPLEKASVLVLNEIEGAVLSGMDVGYAFEGILQALVAKYPRTAIVLTAGENGAYYGYGSTVEHVDACKTSVVDTTGAGDTFLGYFLASQISGKDVKQSLCIASKAASIAVSRPGAMDAIPFASEII